MVEVSPLCSRCQLIKRATKSCCLVRELAPSISIYLVCLIMNTIIESSVQQYIQIYYSYLDRLVCLHVTMRSTIEVAPNRTLYDFLHYHLLAGMAPGRNTSLPEWTSLVLPVFLPEGYVTLPLHCGKESHWLSILTCSTLHFSVLIISSNLRVHLSWLITINYNSTWIGQRGSQVKILVV